MKNACDESNLQHTIIGILCFTPNSVAKVLTNPQRTIDVEEALMHLPNE